MSQVKQLSAREQEVTELLLKGKSNKMIASALGISARTVEFHLKNIYTKFQVGSRTELILKLGNPTGKGKPVADLGQSTVAEREEISENRDSLRATSLREAFSIIGKELRMDSLFNAREEANPETFFGAIRVCLTKYADFNGRATRSEFWWFALFVTLVTSAFTYLSENLGAIFLIAVLLPLLAAGARRCHDSGRSGWWQLFLLVPVGGLVIVGTIWALPPSEAGSE
ncbi:MAG: DUF805 domain-containing protein [Anaerolineales bacterium]|nr:DUF805 domain-containing protein [Anaerolineales bacterium]